MSNVVINDPSWASAFDSLNTGLNNAFDPKRKAEAMWLQSRLDAAQAEAAEKMRMKEAQDKLIAAEQARNAQLPSRTIQPPPQPNLIGPPAPIIDPMDANNRRSVNAMIEYAARHKEASEKLYQASGLGGVRISGLPRTEQGARELQTMLTAKQPLATEAFTDEQRRVMEQEKLDTAIRLKLAEGTTLAPGSTHIPSPYQIRDQPNVYGQGPVRAAQPIGKEQTIMPPVIGGKPLGPVQYGTEAGPNAKPVDPNQLPGNDAVSGAQNLMMQLVQISRTRQLTEEEKDAYVSAAARGFQTQIHYKIVGDQQIPVPVRPIIPGRMLIPGLINPDGSEPAAPGQAPGQSAVPPTQSQAPVLSGFSAIPSAAGGNTPPMQIPSQLSQALIPAPASQPPAAVPAPAPVATSQVNPILKNPREKYTEAQQKIVLMLPIASQSHAVINKMTKDGTLPPTEEAIWNNITGIIPDALGDVRDLVSVNRKRQFDQEAERFITQVLRVQSGATLQPYEIESYKRQFIPRAADDATEIRRKELAREAALMASADIIQGAPLEQTKARIDAAIAQYVAENLNQPDQPPAQPPAQPAGARMRLNPDGSYRWE